MHLAFGGREILGPSYSGREILERFSVDSEGRMMTILRCIFLKKEGNHRLDLDHCLQFPWDWL